MELVGVSAGVTVKLRVSEPGLGVALRVALGGTLRVLEKVAVGVSCRVAVCEPVGVG